MPVPIWVTFAAIKAAGVGAFYLHRKIKAADQKKWPVRPADETQDDKEDK